MICQMVSVLIENKMPYHGNSSDREPPVRNYSTQFHEVHNPDIVSYFLIPSIQNGGLCFLALPANRRMHEKRSFWVIRRLNQAAFHIVLHNRSRNDSRFLVGKYSLREVLQHLQYRVHVGRLCACHSNFHRGRIRNRLQFQILSEEITLIKISVKKEILHSY